MFLNNHTARWKMKIQLQQYKYAQDYAKIKNITRKYIENAGHVYRQYIC